MKACVNLKYGPAESVEIKEVATPAITQDDILVQVHYAIVSPTDCGFRSGKPFISRLFSGLIKPKVKIQGEMYAGVVAEVGENIRDLIVGDKVYGTNGMKLGAYGEYISVHKDTVIRKVPNNVELKDALSLLDGAITALPYLRDKANAKESESVLIIGVSGAVGSYAATLSKAMNLSVTGVCSTKNVELMKDFGCHQVIDYTNEDYTNQPVKYDIVFDAVGKSSFGKCKPILKDNGRYLTTVPSLSALLKSLSKKSKPGKKELFMATGLRKTDEKHKDLEYLEGQLKSKSIKPLEGRVYNFKKIADAQKYVETNHKVGNVFITF